MCCFSKPTTSVSMTTLTAVLLNPRLMRLVYTNEVETKTANAMVLPVYGEFKGFVKMAEEYDKLALSMYQGYRAFRSKGSRGAIVKRAKTAAEVHRYGAYLVSYSPNLGDIDWADGFAEKADTKFMDLMHTRYPPSQGYGFVVAKMDATSTDAHRRKHPIVFDIALKSGENKTMLPTYHLHDGQGEEAEAHWDHLITTVNCQTVETVDGSRTISLTGEKWETYFPMLNKLLGEWQVGDVKFVESTRVSGQTENVDVWITAPRPPVVDGRRCDLCSQDITAYPYYSCMACEDVDFCGTCFSHDAAGKWPGDEERKHCAAHLYQKMAKDGDRTAWLGRKTAATCLWCSNYIPAAVGRSSCATCRFVTQCATCAAASMIPLNAHLQSLGHTRDHTMITVTPFSSTSSS